MNFERKLEMLIIGQTDSEKAHFVLEMLIKMGFVTLNSALVR